MEIIKRQPVQSNLTEELSIESLPTATQMTDQEKMIALTLMSKNSEDITVVIPEDLDKTTFVEWIGSLSKLNATFSKAKQRVQPIIGRMLLLVARRKDLLEEFGCKYYSQFVNEYVTEKLSIGPQDAWDSLFVAREFPWLTCDDFESISMGHLRIISRAVPTDREDKKRYAVSSETIQARKKLVNMVFESRGMKPAVLAKKIEEMGIAHSEDIIKSKIQIRASQAIIEKWSNFCSNRAVQEIVGSDDPAVILECMMAECETTWTAIRGINA